MKTKKIKKRKDNNSRREREKEKEKFYRGLESCIVSIKNHLYLLIFHSKKINFKKNRKNVF
jgi:hypothetical protein